jgi:hypothetical protein
MLLRVGASVEKVVAKDPHRPLSRAVVLSALLHVGLVAAAYFVVKPVEPAKEVVDIELAPPPPKAEALPAEVEKPPAAEQGTAQAASQEPAPASEEGMPIDAGIDAPTDAATDAAIDAPVDASPKKKKRPDAAPDAEDIALADAGVDAPGDGPALATGSYDGSNAGTNETAAGSAGSGSAGSGSDLLAGSAGSGSNQLAGGGSGSGSGVPAAIAMGSGSGAPGMDTQPGVDGAPTSAGTAANLLAYFPPGHLVTALVRFDRLRGTEWAKPAEDLFRPMPDYRVLFGARDADLADKLDTLVVSSPSPRDATATTLVAHTQMTRPEMRDFLSSSPVVWSATRGGLYGVRRSPMQGDKRVVLSPWKNWFVLAQPADVGNWPRVSTSLDAVEAKAKLPAWLQTIRTIEKESGDDKKGPALVVTMTGEGQRYNFPDVGLGVTSLPAPQRLSLAMELVPQGWLVRGNIVFASEADATEVERTLLEVQHRIVGSFVMSRLLDRQHVLNLVKGLSIARTGARVSYATSISIADARALLAALAATLSDYFVSH